MSNQFDECGKSLGQSVRRRTGLMNFGAGVAFNGLAILTLIMMSLTTKVYAQGGVPLWTNFYQGAYGVTDLMVDSSGNAVVTGTSGCCDDTSITTIKYSGAGLPLWTNKLRGGGSPRLAIDSSGNVIVTGDSGDTNYSSVTIECSPAGVPLWTNYYRGAEIGYQEEATAIAVDSNGNTIVTGYSYDLASSFDYFTLKYSAAGVPLWTNRYNGPGNSDDQAHALAVDGNDNVIVTGSSYDAGSDYDYATIKYSAAGISLWTNRYNGPANDTDQATAIAVDGGGNVFVTGQSIRAPGFDYDYATVKYSPAGEELWTQRYDSGDFNGDEASALAVDGSGNVIVTGIAGLGGFSEYVTIKYSGAGAPLWTNHPAAEDNFRPALAVDSSGDVFVAAVSSRSGTLRDFLTMAYSGAGVPLWTNRYIGQGIANDVPAAVAVDSDSNVFVTGIPGYTTIKYSSAALQPVPLNYQIFGNQLVLSWTNSAFSLQSTPLITGNFSNISGAISPFTNPISGPQQYFRLKGN